MVKNMNILLSGISGYMGCEIVKLGESSYRGASVVMGVCADEYESTGIKIYSSFDKIKDCKGVDCIIDFSHHSLTESLISFAKKNKIPTVIATTGHTDSELSIIKNAANYIPVFHSGNMSIGISLLCQLAKTVALAMPEADIEIIEKHHTRKLDAPSGTALMLAGSIKEARPSAFVNTGREGHGKRVRDEIGIHSIRLGNIVGEHEVIIGTPSQTITLKHEAHDRSLFAEGAICAAEFLIGMPKGLYDMKSIIKSQSNKK